MSASGHSIRLPQFPQHFLSRSNVGIRLSLHSFLSISSAGRMRWDICGLSRRVMGFISTSLLPGLALSQSTSLGRAQLFFLHIPTMSNVSEGAFNYASTVSSAGRMRWDICALSRRVMWFISTSLLLGLAL